MTQSDPCLSAAREICQLAHRELYVAKFRPNTGLVHLRAFETIDAIEQQYARIIARHLTPAAEPWKAAPTDAPLPHERPQDSAAGKLP